MHAVQAAREEMVLRHSVVGLPAPLLTSTWKTNPASLWWITKLLLRAGAARSAVEGLLDVVVLEPLIPGVTPGVLLEVVSITGVVCNVALGEDGEIGKRFT
jgi:hypothetical protein